MGLGDDSRKAVCVGGLFDVDQSERTCLYDYGDVDFNMNYFIICGGRMCIVNFQGKQICY